MSEKNKIYWLEGVTEKYIKTLMSDESSRYRWLRLQRNRRILVIFMAIGLVSISLGSYWPTLTTNLGISEDQEIVVYSVTSVLVVLFVLIGYTFLQASVRGLADAPDELLDERQIQIRNSSFRYAYMIMGIVVMILLLLLIAGPGIELFSPQGKDGSYVLIAILFAFAALPSMVLAWRERDI